VHAVYQPFPMLSGRRAQIWRHQPAYLRPRHFHEEPEINVVVKGQCTLGIGDRQVSLSAGQMALFQPGQDHVLLHGSDDLDLFVMALSPALSERVLGLGRLAASGKMKEVANVGSATEELTALCRVVDATSAETGVADRFALALRGAVAPDVLGRRALQIARAEPDVSGTELARRLSTAQSLVSRRFHAEFGLPLVRYRARMKLMRFIASVDAGNSLTHAAFDARFGSYAQCHRVFREALGCSPHAYFAGEREHVNAAVHPRAVGKKIT
jgi:AraC-like DNA-binding protein